MKIPASLLIVALAGISVPLFAQDLSQETDFVVTLLEPLSTATSKRGDKITAQVVSPDAYKGDFMQGMVDESKRGHKIQGKSVLRFHLSTLQHGSRSVQTESSVKQMTNAQGQKDADDEGHLIRKNNNAGKAALATGVGALVGGLVGGGKGAAIGAVGGAVASLVVIEVAVKAPNLSFSTQDRFVLSVKEAKARERK